MNDELAAALEALHADAFGWALHCCDGVQQVIRLSTLRQLVQARDDLEAAKQDQDAIAVGRILTWAEGVLP